jgi:hypothetical protein
LYQFGDAGEAGFGVVPVALIRIFWSGRNFSVPPLRWISSTRPAGLAKTVVAQ